MWFLLNKYWKFINDINPNISAQYREIPNIKLIIPWWTGITVNLHRVYTMHINIFTIINILLYSGFIIEIKNAINKAKIEIINIKEAS